MSRELISIVACTIDGGIGRDNKLIWSLPEDMSRFVQATRGHTVIMGRKTFESVGRPLPNRKNVVVSRTLKGVPEGVLLVSTLDEALVITENDEKVFIIGGETIYNQTINLVDKVMLTYVCPRTTMVFDTFFPLKDLYTRLRLNPFAFIDSEKVVMETPHNTTVSCYSFLTFDFTKKEPK